MRNKDIKVMLTEKLSDFLSIWPDSKDREMFFQNCIVCGGAISSLILDEPLNDIDIYLRTSKALDTYRSSIDTLLSDMMSERRGYDLAFRTPSADTFTHIIDGTMPKFQIIKMMTGEPEDIVQRFDFLHTMVYFDLANDRLSIPNGPKSCILEKRLYYTQTNYPLSSLFRSRKYIRRGWKMPMTEYIKIALDINKFDLLDPTVLISQLQGVDEIHAKQIVQRIREDEVRSSEDPMFKPRVNLTTLCPTPDLESTLPGELRDDPMYA